jgi:endonuclease/exonuclease/phosphatase family metal-dependent hydrolase
MKLKLVCLNMWLGGKLFDTINPFLAEQNADILCLQEVYQAEHNPLHQPWHAVGSLANILGYTYYAFAPAFAEEVEEGYRVQFGNAILSKHPIQKSKSVFFDVPYNGNWKPKTREEIIYTPRNLQHAEVLVQEKNLHIFNIQGIWGFDGDDNERRLAMADVIVREIQGKQPALLMGDFNVQEGGKTTGKIEAHMRPLFKGEMKTSFNMKHKDPTSGYATAIVDMMFVSPGIKIENHHVSDADVSDHLALVAEVEI